MIWSTFGKHTCISSPSPLRFFGEIRTYTTIEHYCTQTENGNAGAVHQF